ncbi:MAG: PASTA domain-containing protein [Rhodobacteraceae bacterium]|nr:PASTA domain-containing protein [Paracoccaceae bacterium]
MAEAKRQRGVWRSRLSGLVIGFLLLFAPLAALAAEFEIFAAIPAREAPTDFEAALKRQNYLKEGQTLADLPAEYQAAIRAISNAETSPSMATAVALLAHFPTLSADKADALRLALIREAKAAFLMADAAKYELILETNKRVHAKEKSLGDGRGIELSLRVGSTGARFAEWQAWVKAERPMSGKWKFTDPTDPKRIVEFDGMPGDAKYLETKLNKADDDVSNWATKAMRDADPLANELVNGARADEEFARLTAKHLSQLPEEMKANLPGGKARLEPKVMKVEFLSPTQMVGIMGDKTLRANKGWNVPIDLTAPDKLNFLGAWVLAHSEKYNGLYAEEQLHAYGMAKGYVSEDPERPLAPETTRTYAQSATEGELKDIVGSNIFPTGIKDPFGWMATNYRQIFVTHKGDLDSVAKYTERMIDWWKNVNLPIKELKKLARDAPGVDPAIADDFDALETLARKIRNAKTAEEKATAIKDGGGKDVALARLKGLNKLMMITGQRKHLEQWTGSLKQLMQEDIAKRTLQERIEKPLTFEVLLNEAERRKQDNAPKNDPYIAFLTTLDAYTNGYANLPEDVARDMAKDIAQFIDSDLLKADGAGQVSAEMRMNLLPVIEESARRAREVGSDLQADADGLRRFSELATSDLGKAISQKLVDLNEPDLHGYLRKLQLGKITRRQVRLLRETDGGWPKLQVVDEIWRPADIGDDLKRMMWLGENLGWTDATFAHRLAAYFNGPDYRVPTDPGVKPSDRRSYADDAMDAFLGFTRLFDPAASTVRFVRLEGPDGEPVVRQLRGSHFADATLNMGLITFEHTLRGAEGLQKMWGLKGDIESLTTFAKTLHALSVASPDMDQAAKAKMLATLAAESYGSFSAIVQNFGNEQWQDWMERNMGKGSTVLGKAGGTVGALLSNAGDSFQTPESKEALFGAIVTDLLVVWQPQVATVMALNAMYSAGKAYLVTEGAKADMIDLLVKNGVWEFPSDGSPPKLLKVYLGGKVINDDAKARAEQCKLRSTSAFAPKEKPNPEPVGLHRLVKFVKGIPEAGVPLCRKIENSTCEPEHGRLVIPREAALALFDASPQKSSDPILTAIKDTIDARVGWENLDFIRRAISWDDGSKWTAERLKTLEIEPPTPEDSSFLIRGKVRIDLKQSDFSNRPRDINKMQIHQVLWGDMSKGSRRMVGYMASEYWVRRQYLIECVMLDPWIQAAGRKAQKDDYKGIDIGDVAGRLADLDRRMRALDQKVWPMIAPSHQPFPISADAPQYPADQQLALYDHYLKATHNIRADLRDLIKFFEGEQTPENLPMKLIERAWARQNAGVPVDTSSYSSFFSAMRVDTTRGMASSASLLQTRVENLLGDAADMVVKYEDGLDNAMKQIAATRKYVAFANGYDIAPVHVALLPIDSYQPPEGGKYGEVEDHLFPKGGWHEAGLFEQSAENALLASFADWSTAGDGTMGARLREWHNGYEQVRVDARNELAETLAPHKKSLVEEMTSGAEIRFNDSTRPFETMLATQTADLADAHPIFPRILRQIFQVHKISLANARKDRLFGPETIRIAGAFKTDVAAKPAKTESGGDAPTPPAADAASRNVIDLDAFSAAFLIAANRLQDRADNLFKIDITRPDPPYKVSESLEVKYKAEPFKGETDPLISDDDIRAWTDQVYWEIARDTSPGQIILPPPSGDPDAPVVFLGPENLPDLSDPASAVTEATPELLRCDASRSDPKYEAVVAVIQALADKDRGAKIPLISPGNFRLRATALGKYRTPLARRTIAVEIVPMELRGRLIITGGEVDTATGQRVLVQVNEPDLPNFDGTLASFHPIIPLYKSGLFRSQLCGALSPFLLVGDQPPPGVIGAETAANDLIAEAMFIPGARAAQSALKKSDKVRGAYIEPGVIGLRQPLEILLDAGQAVPVRVVVHDASDREIAPDRSEIIVGETRVEGTGPISLDIIDGETLSATASLAVLGGSVEGQSAPLAFSVREHSEGVPLRVDLDAYAKGNLEVLGSFELPQNLRDQFSIAGGTVWSNLLPDTGDRVLGDRFGFNNFDPVALENGMKLDAILFAGDAEETLFRAVMEPVETLPKGGHLTLPPITVQPFVTKEVEFRARATDATGHEITSDSLVKVTLDGEPMSLSADTYSAHASFSGMAQKLKLRAEYSMAEGIAFVEQDIGIDTIGDLIDPKSPAPFELRIPVYVPGSLRLSGSYEITAAELSDETPPVDYAIGFQGGTVIEERKGNEDNPFLFDLSFPVRVGDNLLVNARTRIGSDDLKGSAQAPAPQPGLSRPATLDLGVIRLEPFLDLIEVPRLIGMDIKEAEKQFEKLFKFQVHRIKTAPENSDVGKIHAQAPLPHGKDKPSRVPRGLTISVAVYRGKELLTLRDYRTEDPKAAQAELIGLGVRDAQTIAARRAQPDETAGKVIRQSPPAGTEIDAATATVMLYYLDPPLLVSGRVVPDPDPKPDPVVEPDPDPDPVVDHEPDTGSADGLVLAGGWNGRLKVEHIKLVGVQEGTRIAIDCASMDQCAGDWVRNITRLLDIELDKQEAAKKDDNGNPLDLGGAVGDAIADAMGIGILLGMGVGGVVVVDMIFDGVDYGFIISETETGGYHMQFPDSSPEIDAILKQARTSLTDRGGLKISLPTYPLPKGGGVMSFTGLVEPSETGATLTLTANINTPPSTAGSVDVTVSVSGDFTAGDAAMEPLAPKIAADVKARFSNPDPKLEKYMAGFEKIKKRLEKDD